MRSIFLTAILSTLFWASNAEARRKKAGATDTSSVESALPQEEVLSQAKTFLSKNQPERALEVLTSFLEDKNNKSYFPQAYELQLKTLRKLKLPYTRFQFFPTALKNSLPSEEAKTLLEDFIDLSEELGEEGLLPEVLTSSQISKLKKSDQELILYQKAKNALRKSEFAKSLELAQSMPKESEYYTKALNIEAVTLSQQGRFDEALLPFNRALKRMESSKGEEKLRNIIQLNLARNFYAAGIFSAAIEGFDAIPRTSPYWLEAQFEKAWALFRQQEINPMLGILQTHTTEFFVDGVYPEEEMLRIYGFFLLCKFETTSAAVDVFETRYNEHLITLREWNARSESDLFYGFAKRRNGDFPRMLSRHFEFEDQMNEAVYTVQAIDKEISKLEGLGSFTQSLVDNLKSRKETIVQQQGKRIKSKGISKAQKIVGMLQNMNITRLDIGELKQRILNKEAVTGKRLTAKREAKRKIRFRRDSNVWAYQGEQWADELGYYQIKVSSSCPADF